MLVNWLVMSSMISQGPKFESRCTLPLPSVLKCQLLFRSTPTRYMYRLSSWSWQSSWGGQPADSITCLCEVLWQRNHTASFLSFGIIDFWGLVVLSRRGSRETVLCMVGCLSRISGFYSLDSSSTTPDPVVPTKTVSRLQMSLVQWGWKGAKPSLSHPYPQHWKPMSQSHREGHLAHDGEKGREENQVIPRHGKSMT